MQQKKTLVPPDGGWGWMIVLAYALNNVMLIPIMQNFGLVFKDTFIQLGFSATDGSIIINTNAACSMLTGLINGPLLKYYGFRKVSLAAAFFATVGVILTAYADSFIWFLVSYGFVTSLGMGMGLSSYPLALNSYFIKRRSKATGIAMTITGLGPVIMPQLISFLLYCYDIEGAVLIIGGIASHSFVAALLLQPLKWHLIEELVDEEAGPDDLQKLKLEDETTVTLLTADSNINRKIVYDKQKSLIMQSNLSIDHDLEVQAIYGFDTPLAGSVLSLNQARHRKFSESSYLTANDQPTINKWWSTASINKSEKLYNARIERQRSESENKENITKQDSFKESQTEKEKPVYDPDLSLTIIEAKPGVIKRVLLNIVNIFDLTLLKDPIYVNIMLGMSLAVFAELNFSLLTPFIMADFNLSTGQIATFLSVLSIADILFRFLSPFIGDFLDKPARIMYMFSLVLLILTRSTLLYFEEYSHLLGVAAALGIAKGIRTVYWTLVIPNYVPIERLANASGIQMVVNGLFILCGGPLLGVIRDVTGSYKKCIIVINAVTACTLTMWTVELLLARRPKKTKNTEVGL